MTLDELQAKAASRYSSTLAAVLGGGAPFPVQIGYKRPSMTGNPTAILRLKELLRRVSKQQVGYGPTIEMKEVQTRRFDAGSVPGNIVFTELDDLTRFIGKKKEADRIIAHARLITDTLPAARAWTSRRLDMLLQRDVDAWQGILSAVQYFMRQPKPWIYARELPLGLHTKFVEQNHRPIIELLAEVAPHALNEPYTSWQDRLGLRSGSELIEGRFLDPTIAPNLPQHMITPVAEWNRWGFSKPIWVLITENRTTFLTLPPLPGCLALLGKGYAVTKLAQLDGVHNQPVRYWGDIDQHGFEILASLRSHVRHVESILMGSDVLAKFPPAKEEVARTLDPEFVRANLAPDEQVLWDKCVGSHLRLEQEHIPLAFAKEVLERIVTEAWALPGRLVPPDQRGL